MTKKIIDVRSKKLEIDLLTTEDAIELFTRLQEECGKDSLIRFNTDWEGDVSFYVCYKREETDAEYAERVEREILVANMRKQQDLKLLAELKAKYEQKPAEII